MTGGGTLANFEADTNGGAGIDTAEETQYGFVVGGGIEHKFDETIAVRAEYLYAHYFRDDYGFGAIGFVDRADIDMHVIRAAIVIHLGGIFGPH